MLRSLIHRLPLSWALRLALLRLTAQWQSLLTIVIGVLLAGVIGANAPLYTAAVAQVGMVQRLAQAPPEDVHLFSRISLTSLDVDDLGQTWQDADAVVQNLAGEVFESALPGWVRDVVPWAESAPMFVVRDGEDIPDTRMRVAHYAGWQDAVRLIEGEWPTDRAGDGFDLEVALSLRASIQLGLTVGDTIILDQRGWETSQPIRARITALVAEQDEADPYWMPPSPLRVDGSSQYAAEPNALTTRAGFLRVAQEYVPQTRSLLGWRVLFDHTQLPYTAIPDAVARLKGFEAGMSTLFTPVDGRTLNFVYTTRLADVLTRYAGEVSLLGAPFGLLLLQIGALVLFFLVATATLVRRGERRELAMLQSRGAFDRQLVVLRGMEALLIAVACAVLAPFVARWLLVGLAPVFTGIERLPLVLNSQAFLFAMLAAGFAFVALMATLRPVLRQPLILAGGSAARADVQPWWQRYYLDILLFIVGGAALWRLVNTSSPLSGTQLGGLEADPLLLMAPALLFVALGSVLLRMFPGVMSLLARYFARRDGLSGALATWQVSRESAHYGRIALLLTLAIGIGWFATSFRATVNRSHNDQARYAVGTDVRLQERDIVLDVDRVRPLAVYQNDPEVVAASPVMRYFNADVSNDRQRPIPGEVLAIDSDTFGNVLYWRTDLGPVKAPRAPGQALDLPVPGRVLPVRPERIGVWARFDVPGFSFSAASVYQPDLNRLLQRTELYLRLRDETGAFLHVPFEAVQVEWTRLGVDRPGLDSRSFNTTGWVYLEASLAGLDYAPQGDLRLEAIYWRHRARNTRQENDLRLSFADLTLIAPDGTTTSLNWLTDSGWELVYDSGALIRDGATASAVVPDRAQTGRQVVWDQRGLLSTLGIVLDYPEAPPVPAIASTSLMAVNGLQPGDTYRLINIDGVSPQVQVLDTVDYYPTLYADQRPFLVVDQAALLYAINRRPGAAVYADEMWLRLQPGVDSASFVARLDVEGDSYVILRQETLAQRLRALQTNPLALGLMGLLFLAFIVALVLSVVGLVTYAALTAQGRRGEFGVLRAMGLSLERLAISLALEQSLVVLTGVLLGAGLGAVLSDRVVPTLAIGATGETITPPFVVQVETVALLQYVGIMGLVLVAVLGASLYVVRRLSLSQTLRLGEE
ncbi:MAG: hypothetical protein Kow0077_02110 [Anaerolineae bacterium]